MGRYGLAFSEHLFAAVDPGAFGDAEAFKRETSAFTDYLRSTPPAKGHERVSVPNDLECATEQTRRRSGMPLHREVLDWLDAT